MCEHTISALKITETYSIKELQSNWSFNCLYPVFGDWFMQWKDISAAVTEFISDQHLPADFSDLSARFFFPLAVQIAAKHNTKKQPLLLGINGAQGTGKSTLAALLKCMLESGAGL